MRALKTASRAAATAIGAGTGMAVGAVRAAMGKGKPDKKESNKKRWGRQVLGTGMAGAMIGHTAHLGHDLYRDIKK